MAYTMDNFVNDLQNGKVVELPGGGEEFEYQGPAVTTTRRASRAMKAQPCVGSVKVEGKNVVVLSTQELRGEEKFTATILPSQDEKDKLSALLLVNN